MHAPTQPKLVVTGSLVWVKGLRGPTAEKWPDDAIDAAKSGKVVLAQHKLGADEYALTIAILEVRYPAPAVPE